MCHGFHAAAYSKTSDGEDHTRLRIALIGRGLDPIRRGENN
jgi:hypothetical protein